ncbi:MAG: M48 family metallopeptidase [Pseudomonadota bacterium]
MAEWPPPHAVRISGRVRRVLLRMHPERGLEVVTPRRLSERKVAELLDLHRDWIERHLPLLRTWPLEQIPSSIHLPALDQQWTIEHVASAEHPRLHIHPEARRLVLRGAPASLWPLLGRWLTAQAKAHLLPRLDDLATQHGFRLTGSSIRWSRTRWGSCSRRGSISLSARLLWLQPAAVHYVLLHELTHLEHFHHGPAFWQALEARLPGARLLDRQLRQAGRDLPGWLPLLK